MNYRDYLAEILTWATVTDEVDYNRDENNHVVIIKELMGNVYKDTQVKTLQLEVHTNDVVASKALLETFVKTYDKTEFYDELEYVKQYYALPMVLANFNLSGNNYSSTIIVTATLIISSNISDIKQVLIDGEIYETTQRTLTYTSIPDNQGVSMDGNVNVSQIRNAILRFTCMLISRGDTLTHKIRNIRRGNLPVNTTFTVKLIHTDNDDIESYNMKLESNSVTSNNSALPVLSISFIK